jgi:type IV pilus assembly protein PilN
MIRINLLPYRAERKKEHIIQQVVYLAAPLLLVFIVIAAVHISMNSKITATGDSIVTLKEDIKKSRVAIREIDDYKKKKADLLKKMEIIATLEKGKQGPVHILDDLASRLPGNLWLTSVKQTNMNLVIQGKALDNISISNYMLGLEESPYFTDVDLGKVQTGGRGGVLVKDFIITCVVTYQPASQKKVSG